MCKERDGTGAGVVGPLLNFWPELGDVEPHVGEGCVLLGLNQAARCLGCSGHCPH
jgi:hypothetical protein